MFWFVNYEYIMLVSTYCDKPSENKSQSLLHSTFIGYFKHFVLALHILKSKHAFMHLHYYDYQCIKNV